MPFSRHRSGSQRYENDSRRPVRRSPSPPMAFRRDSSAYSRPSRFLIFMLKIFLNGRLVFYVRSF